MTIVSLAKAREEREPHWSGECVCLGCRHEWVGVGPIGTADHLECPSCGLPKGTVKHPFGAQAGDLALTCAQCGGEALTAYKRDGYLWVRCMSCGNDLTEAFFDA